MSSPYELPPAAAAAADEEEGAAFADYLEKYSVNVVKADFKFNAAHFVAYKGFRERLHGHNYTVGVRLEAEGVQSDGYVVDFGDIKKVARKLCKDMNELFLCPANSDVMEITATDETLSIKCEDGATFSFPRQDAVMLPIKHSTVEELAHYLCTKIIESYTMKRLTDRGITVLHVTVSEAPGQDATYSRTFKHVRGPAGLVSPREWRPAGAAVVECEEERGRAQGVREGGSKRAKR